ncbi:MAG: Hsp20/alpha crystallin family protein [Candidatus Paceibacterota bacterium]
MASFFEKLKKGMGIEFNGEVEEPEPTKPPTHKKPTKEKKEKTEKKPRTPRVKKEKPAEIETEEIELPEAAPEFEERKEELDQEEPIREEKPKQKEIKRISLSEDKSVITKVKEEKQSNKSKWMKEPEGQLTVDVYQIDSHLIIQSAIAGVRPEDLDLTLEDDRVIIRGKRQNPIEGDGDYFTKECYWGPFSREIILPVEVNLHGVEAEMKDGILIIRIPKIMKERVKKIVVKESK